MAAHKKAPASGIKNRFIVIGFKNSCQNLYDPESYPTHAAAVKAAQENMVAAYDDNYDDIDSFVVAEIYGYVGKTKPQALPFVELT